jgi:two-component system cell cycle response regulator
MRTLLHTLDRTLLDWADPTGGGSTALPDNARPMAGPRPEQARNLVLVLNHGGDALADLETALRNAGYEVRQTSSLAESNRVLEQDRPDAVVLSPIGLLRGSVEIELLEGLQSDEDPLPVLVLVDDLAALADVRQWRLPLRDFVRRPLTAAEGVHRLDLLLLHKRRHRVLVQRAQKLEGQISVDFKTGLLSELYFGRVLQLEWKRAQRHQNPLSFLLVDVDDFKSVNDTTEYSFGDEVLRRVGETLRATVRETDFAARCGGDEFCVLLPQTTPAEAVHTAMRIRQRIAEMDVRRGSYSRQVTVSIGIDAFDGRTLGSVEILRSNANKALQFAKKKGKNQVWLFIGEVDGARE